MEPEETKHQVPPSDGRDWSAQVAELLENWHKRVYAAQSAHYAAADRFRLLNYVVHDDAVNATSREVVYLHATIIEFADGQRRPLVVVRGTPRNPAIKASALHAVEFVEQQVGGHDCAAFNRSGSMPSACTTLASIPIARSAAAVFSASDALGKWP